MELDLDALQELPANEEPEGIICHITRWTASCGPYSYFQAAS